MRFLPDAGVLLAGNYAVALRGADVPSSDFTTGPANRRSSCYFYSHGQSRQRAVNRDKSRRQSTSSLRGPGCRAASSGTRCRWPVRAHLHLTQRTRSPGCLRDLHSPPAASGDESGKLDMEPTWLSLTARTIPLVRRVITRSPVPDEPRRRHLYAGYVISRPDCVLH